MHGTPMSSRAMTVAAWFLALSFTIPAPSGAWLEYQRSFFSERFGWPPELMYAVFAIQFVAGMAVLRPAWSTWAAAALALTTAGAAYSHFRIGMPQTSVPALAYTALEVWFGLKSYVANRT
jgi:uncharacterized membrane protein YphA (DoxX/SURF4 family)